jgi:hypothetical protein
MQIDAVEKRTANFAKIPPNDRSRAAAIAIWVAQESALAPVQFETTRVRL